MIKIYCYIKSAAIWGIEPYIVNIEADITTGMPYFNMVGLLASEVREARERVRSALKNTGEILPTGRITINLSPADRKKEGTGFDLPIAIALLCSMQRLSPELFADTLIIGELGLDGEIKHVKGILPIVNMSGKHGIKKCIIPDADRTEGHVCSEVSGVEVMAFKTLKDIIEFYTEHEYIDPHGESVNNNILSYHQTTEQTNRTDKLMDKGNIIRTNDKAAQTIIKRKIDKADKAINNDSNKSDAHMKNNEDYCEIYGQEAAKRAIVIAVSGHHNLLMIGSPGVGKSMLASRSSGIMPELTMEERLEVSGIYSVCGLLKESGLVDKRPFSSPHHTVTTAALIGGGHIPRPGEITMAHKGVLFLDELPEFQPHVLDALRQPLEEKVVKIHRNGGSYVFPADCLLIAAMNPCRCGYYPDRNKCNCSIADVKRYLSKVSGPLLDRMDMSIEVPRVRPEELEPVRDREIKERTDRKVMSSKDMKKMVDQAIAMQSRRQNGIRNSSLSSQEILHYCILDSESQEFMHQAYEKFEMSMRSYYKILKIARTIADVEESEKISITHLSEALAYRVSVGEHYKIMRL